VVNSTADKLIVIKKKLHRKNTVLSFKTFICSLVLPSPTDCQYFLQPIGEKGGDAKPSCTFIAVKKSLGWQI